MTFPLVPRKLHQFVKKTHQRLSTPRYRKEIERQVRHHHGELGSVEANDLVVVALMRDAEDHVRSFIRHHLQMGAKKIVLLDNGSVDASVELACQFDQTVVLECKAPFATHQYLMRQYLLKCYGLNCWCLIADIDERFDYPYSSEMPLRDFLDYLNRHNFSGVVAYMLDMFAEGSLSEWSDTTEVWEQEHRFFDMTDIERQPYRAHRTNTLSISELKKWNGGIRMKAFSMSSRPNLTKHPLLFPSRGAIPSFKSAHQCRHTRLADVTCLLKHYKFDRQFRERCQLAVDRKNYGNASSEYQEYLTALQNNPLLALKSQTAQQFVSTTSLAASGLLHVSPSFQEYYKSLRRRAA